MRIQRYFGILLVASVMCFIFLGLNSRLVQTEIFRHPVSALQRYTRQVKELWSSDEHDFYTSGEDYDEVRTDYGDHSALNSKEYNDAFRDVQELIKKLIPNSSTTESENVQINSEKQLNADNESCRPENNIVFLKTHKTGSSTLTNIFNRYADLRELKVALPITGYNRFRWPMYFHWTSVDIYRLGHSYANILCNHARYQREAMDSIMELDSTYVTILRDPVQQFESMFDYMELSRHLGLENTSDPMRRFLEKPYQYLRSMSISNPNFPPSMNLIRNGMFFDLGLNPRSIDNKTLVLKAIRKIEQEFSLVLIMEYYDESLVLLKRELCWNIEDIVYAKFNQRHRSKKEKLTPNLTRMIKMWNGADVLLYQHFNRTFWKKIKKHGQDFYKDLKEFRIKNREVQDECISPVMAKEKAFRLTKEVTKLQLNPLVSNFDRYFCNKILTDEVEYLKYFRFKLNPRFPYQRQLLLEERAQTNLFPQNTEMQSESGNLPAVQFVDLPPNQHPIVLQDG